MPTTVLDDRRARNRVLWLALYYVVVFGAYVALSAWLPNDYVAPQQVATGQLPGALW